MSVVTLALLASSGIVGPVAETVRIEAATGLNGRSATVSVGYQAYGKRIVTAEILMHSMCEAQAMLADADRVAALIAQGVAAMPSVFRPDVPKWIADSADAARADAMRLRATALARRAANDVADLPWAA